MRVVILTLGAFAAALALAAVPVAKEPTYVGASECKLCHKAELQGRQFVIWQASLHAKSAASLKTEKAASYAAEAGVKDPSSSPACLGCHAPLYAKAPKLKDEGVTCEVCHGPGSDYKKLSIMQDRPKAVQNGLVLYGDLSAIRAHCLLCHQSAHGVAFDFEAAWEKVKHPVPSK